MPTTAMMQARLPASIESAPRSAPTVRSSITVSGAGSAPARSSSARSRALSTVKLPLMMPLPPRMASRITGAEMILSSSTMAKRRPTFFEVASPNLRAPSESNLKEITGRPPWSKLCCASTRFSPATSALFSMHSADSARPLHHMERELCFRADQPLQLFDVRDARHLHDDAVLALAHDGRLARAGFIDAAANHLDRLFDRALLELRQACLAVS